MQSVKSVKRIQQHRGVILDLKNRLQRFKDMDVKTFQETMASTSTWSEEMDCETFISPKKTSKAPIVKTYPPKISNSFGVLETEKNTHSKTSSPTPTITSPTNGQKRCPPVIITQKIGSYTQFHQKLKTIIKSRYLIKYTKEDIKITTKEMSDYKALISALKKEDIQYFSHTPSDQVKKKMVLKAACFMTESEIIQEITKGGKIKQDEIDCIKMKGKNPNSRSFLVNIAKSCQIQDLKKIEEIDHVKIQWQKYSRKSPVTQCYRCQKLGHGSSNCNRIPKCVKCAKNHLTKDCEIKEKNSELIQCANCDGPHTANYSKCPIILRYVDSLIHKSPQKPENIPKIPDMKQFPPLKKTSYHPVTNQISYLEMAKKSSPKTQQTIIETPISNQNNLDDFQTLIKEIQELNSICNISQLISLVRDIKNQIQTCTSPLNKILIIQNLIEKHGI